MSISFNLSKKLIFLVMIVSIISLSITGFLSFNYADEILKQKTGDQLIGESTARGETLHLILESRIEQNNILANDPMIQILISEMNKFPQDDLKTIKEKKRKDYLIQIQAFQELIGFSVGLEDVKIIGKSGNVFFSLDGVKNENYRDNEFFKKGLQNSLIDFVPSDSGKKMIVVSPVFSKDKQYDDEPIGIIISKMRTTALDNILLNRSGLGESGEVYIVNSDFMMLSESRFFENAIFQQVVDTTAVQKCFNENQEYIGFYLDYRDTPIYGSSYCANDLGIVLLAEIDETEIEKPINILQDRIIQTGIIITIVMSIFTFAVSKTISRPLIKLKSAANNIASGNFGVRTNIKTKDEIGELSSAFDLMAQKLQESLIEIKEKEDVIKQQEDILLQFSDRSEKYCVGMIDIINSTKICSNLSNSDASEFYKIFINFMGSIIRKYDGVVVKNIGDALLFSFAVNSSKEEVILKKCLDCCLTLSSEHSNLVEKLEKQNLPSINYRISATYGMVRIAKSSTSSVDDIFGTTVNRCAKLNRSASVNGIVIGEDFFNLVKDFDRFMFKKITNDLISSEHDYVGYSVAKKSFLKNNSNSQIR